MNYFYMSAKCLKYLNQAAIYFTGVAPTGHTLHRAGLHTHLITTNAVIRAAIP